MGHLQRWRFAVILGWMLSEGQAGGFSLPRSLHHPHSLLQTSNKSANPYSWPCTTRAYSKPHKNGECVAGKYRNPGEREKKEDKKKRKKKIIILQKGEKMTSFFLACSIFMNNAEGEEIKLPSCDTAPLSLQVPMPVGCFVQTFNHLPFTSGALVWVQPSKAA